MGVGTDWRTGRAFRALWHLAGCALLLAAACGGAQLAPLAVPGQPPAKAVPRYVGGAHVTRVLAADRVVISHGRLDGLLPDAAKLPVFGVRRTSPTNTSSEFNGDVLLARAKVIALRDREAEVQLSVQATAVELGDYVEHAIVVPSGMEDDPLFELAAMDILLRELSADTVIYELADILATPTEAGKSAILQRMVMEIRAQADLAKSVLTDRIEGGRFHGNSLAEAFAKTTPDDVRAFLLFVRAFPGKYIAHRWKLVEVYATWIINRTPLGDADLAGRKAQVHNREGNRLAAAGDFVGAELAWRKALALVPDDEKVKEKLKSLQDIRLWYASLQRDPDDASVRWSLAVALFRRDAYAACAAQLDALDRLKYKPSEVMRYRAMILARQERYREAAAILRDIERASKSTQSSIWLRYAEQMERLKAEPGSHAAAMALGKVHEEEKAWEDALSDYRQAQDNAATAEEVQLAHRGQQRVGTLRELDTQVKWAEGAIKSHDIKGALARVKRVVDLCARIEDETPSGEKRPTRARASQLLAQLAEKAYSHFEEAFSLQLRLLQLRLDPQNVDAHLAKAWLQLRAQDTAAAKQSVAAALAIDPKREYGHQILARIALLEGDFALAEAEARAALTDATYAWPRLTLARALVGQGRYPQAAEAAEDAWKLMPEESDMQAQRQAVLEARDAQADIAAGKSAERARLRLVRALVALDMVAAADAETSKMAKGGPLWKAARDAVADSASTEAPLALVLKAAVDVGGTDERSTQRREWLEARLALAAQPADPGLKLRLAKAQALRGEFNRALATVGEAKPGTPQADLVELARQGNQADEVVTLSDEAFSRSDAESAEKLLRRAIEMFERIGSTRVHMAKRSLAFAISAQGRHQEALTLLREALPQARRTGDASAYVPVELKIADIESFLGKLSARREALEKVRAGCEEMDNVYCQANMYIDLGDQAMTDGRLAEAQKLVERGLVLAERCGVLRIVRNGRGTLADVQLVAGNLQEARKLADALLIESRKAKDINSERMALMLLGATATRLGDVKTATTRFSEVYDLGTRNGDNWVRAQARLFEGRAWLDAAHDAAKAEALLSQAVELYGGLGDQYNQGRALLALGEANKAQGRVERASKDLELALDLARKSEVLQLVTRVLSELGLLRVKQGQLDLALSLAAEATRSADQSDVPEERWKAHHALALTLDARKEPDRAFAEFERTIADLVETLSRTGTADADRDNAMSVGRTRDAFKDAVDFCMRSGRVEKALEWLELSRDATLRRVFDPTKLKAQSEETKKALEAVKTAELQAAAAKKALQDELAKPEAARSQARVEALGKVAAGNDRELRQLMLQLNAKNPRIYQALSIKAEDVRELQKSLPEGTVVVEYFLADDALYIFVIARESGRPRAFKVDVAAADVERAVFEWRTAIAAHNPVDRAELEKRRSRGQKRAEVFGMDPVEAPKRSRELGQKLYNWLLAPIEAELKLAKTAMLVPYGPLYYLPFHALEHSGPDGSLRYAIEDTRLGYLSAATKFRLGATEAKAPRTLLAFANPDGSLPGARAEIDRVRKDSFPEAQVYYEGDATKEKFLKLADQFSVIHFATHGVLSSDATASYLKMAGEPLTVFEISGLEGLYGKTDLVVLSACDTALQLGKSTGEELISVATAFSMAGAPALVASLWEVDDEATAELMAEFYRLLKVGRGADGAVVDTLGALRLAQLKVLGFRKEGRAVFESPGYWAAFQLIGDFR